MNKKYSIEELEELAKAVFKKNSKASYLLATRDGQFFLPGKEFAAHNHANGKGGLKVHKLANPTKKEKKEKEPKTDKVPSKKTETKTTKSN